MTNLDSGQELKLSASETWYMMGYVGGEYAHATKQVKYAPNDQALQAVSYWWKYSKEGTGILSLDGVNEQKAY